MFTFFKRKVLNMKNSWIQLTTLLQKNLQENKNSINNLSHNRLITLLKQFFFPISVLFSIFFLFPSPIAIKICTTTKTKRFSRFASSIARFHHVALYKLANAFIWSHTIIEFSFRCQTCNFRYCLFFIFYFS